jgi:hypothetical protein
MIRALETAGVGYFKHVSNLDSIAQRIVQKNADSNVSHDIVDLVVIQHRAQACLLVVKVADSLGESLMHIVA